MDQGSTCLAQKMAMHITTLGSDLTTVKIYIKINILNVQKLDVRVAGFPELKQFGKQIKVNN